MAPNSMTILRYNSKRSNIEEPPEVVHTPQEDSLLRDISLNLFGAAKSADTPVVELSSNHPYYLFVNRRLKWLQSTAAGRLLLPDHPAALHLFNAVINVVTANTQLSPDDIVQTLVQRGNIDPNSWSTLQNNVRQLVFAVVGLISLVYIADIPPHSLTATFELDKGETTTAFRTSQPIQMSERPIAEILRGFGVAPFFGEGNLKDPHSVARHPSESSRILRVANLNAFTLQKIGGLQIHWVYCLSAHLQLDLVNRRLNLFRLPSFCKWNLSADGAFARTPNPVPALLEEVMLSYRLFFAQHKRSLERYRHLERRRLEDEDHIIDPLLDELCGCTRPSFGNFLPKQSYDTQFDFPILGTRLLFIQEYIVNQQPSGFKELWNDRRDGLKWFTFWAVIFFGTLGGSFVVFAACSLRCANIY
ncbi:hypothetical protein N7444_002741 [Penicillium canescens]|nr:hypothetical protein N7444_002741 [Penicillium canescens]